MRTILKQVAIVATAMCMCLLANGQGKGNHQKNTKLDSSKPTMLTNNGKLLSKKGIESINISDVKYRNVWNDTILISVKKEVFEQLDKDSSNYAKMPKGISRWFDTVRIN